MGKRPSLVAVVGAIGAGKSTFAQRLVDAHGFTPRAIATPLKRLCAQQFGWDPAQLDTLEYKEAQAPGLADGWTRRRVLQHIGTEGFRAVDPEHWIKQTAAQVRADLEAGRSVVITDLRFQNEADMLRPLGCVVVRVRRGGAPRSAFVGHSSEAESDGIRADHDFTIPEGIELVRATADDFARSLKPAPRPVVIASAVVRRSDGAVLLGRRIDTKRPELHGKWEFPGGHIEARESPTEAAERELREELGLDVVALGIDTAAPISYTDPNGNVGHYVILFVGCALPLGRSNQALRLDGVSHSEARWFLPNEIPCDLMPSARAFYERRPVRA